MKQWFMGVLVSLTSAFGWRTALRRAMVQYRDRRSDGYKSLIHAAQSVESAKSIGRTLPMFKQKDGKEVVDITELVAIRALVSRKINRDTVREVELLTPQELRRISFAVSQRLQELQDAGLLPDDWPKVNLEDMSH